MLALMLNQIIENEHHHFDGKFSPSFLVLMVKFPSSVALHLYLYPEVLSGMVIMKFANNQPHLFTKNHGSEISFMIGFMQVFTAVFCEMVNCYLLSFQQSVEMAIIHFVALEVILEVPKMYFEALADNALKEVLHYHP